MKPLWPKFRFLSQLTSDNCEIVIKFLENNHVHCVATGKDFKTVYEKANSTMAKLGLEYAYDVELGTLTTEPDTVGCGMKLEAKLQVRNKMQIIF